MPREIPDVEAIPMPDEQGGVLLYDLYVNGNWVGSRRTPAQCQEWLSHLCGVKVEAVRGLP